MQMFRYQDSIFERIMRNELTIIGSWCTISAPYPGEEWNNAVEYIGNKKVDVLGMVTHKVNLSKGPEMFEEIIANPKSFGKVMLYQKKSCREGGCFGNESNYKRIGTVS